MKYMTDANISGLAKELRSHNIDCETVHKLMLNDEDTRVQIKDPQIVKFLTNQKEKITLITMDDLLAEYCKTFEIPCIGIQDLVADYIMKNVRP